MSIWIRPAHDEVNCARAFTNDRSLRLWHARPQREVSGYGNDARFDRRALASSFSDASSLRIPGTFHGIDWLPHLMCSRLLDAFVCRLALARSNEERGELEAIELALDAPRTMAA
jgi:hypothetical protein